VPGTWFATYRVLPSGVIAIATAPGIRPVAIRLHPVPVAVETGGSLLGHLGSGQN